MLLMCKIFQIVTLFLTKALVVCHSFFVQNVSQQEKKVVIMRCSGAYRTLQNVPTSMHSKVSRIAFPTCLMCLQRFFMDTRHPNDYFHFNSLLRKCSLSNKCHLLLIKSNQICYF